MDNSVPPEMIFIPFCYAEAAANTLTNPALDPIGKIPEFKFCAARVERMAEKKRVCSRFLSPPVVTLLMALIRSG